VAHGEHWAFAPVHCTGDIVRVGDQPRRGLVEGHDLDIGSHRQVAVSVGQNLGGQRQN
jgi:hypothetical protein